MSDKCKDEKTEKCSEAEVRQQFVEGFELAYGARKANFCKPRLLIEDGNRAGIIIHAQLQDPKSEVPELLELYDEAQLLVDRLKHHLSLLKKKPRIKQSTAEKQDIEKLSRDLQAAQLKCDQFGYKILQVATVEFGKVLSRRCFNLTYIL